MHLTEHKIVRKLPLSHTIYRDNEIDASKAEQLVVYHYPLAKSYRWKEWEEHLDSELSDRYYPYLMRSYNGQFGLFVALNTPDEKPPVIKNSDGIEILPERIRYAPAMNPIWVRLIMRKAVAFGSHCKGSHTLGRPLLKIDVWQGKKSTGINAISLDCRTQQLADRNTTEVVLFYENVPLRPFSNQEDPSKYRRSLWTYGKNSVLVRWIPTHGNKPQGTLYQEIRKNSDRRMQRPFIDLGSVKALKSSWPCILKSVRDELIKQAAIFGFTLKPKVLNLTPLPLRTKYKSNPSTRSLIPSIPLNTLVEVLDLRMTKAIPTTEVVELIQQVLDDKKLGTKLRMLPDIDPDDIDKIEFHKNQRVLILLDQLKGVVDDRYPLTQILRTKVACQHINVNPYDLAGDSVESNLLIEQSDRNDNIYLIPEAGSKYYEYDISQFDRKQCKEALKRNAEIAIKELELKHLLLDPDAKISTSLPEQKDLLTENLIVITEGHLFTVRDDRPIVLPFNPAVPKQVKACDDVLCCFNTSVGSLLTLLQQNWPYSYKPEAVMQGFGSPTEKLSRLARQLTIVMYKSDAVSIFFQDPKYDKPRMIPLNLDEAVKILSSQNVELPIQKWQLPQKEMIVEHTEQLVEDGELTSKQEDALLQELDSLTNCWNATLRHLLDRGLMQVDYKELKQGCLNCLLEKKNACLGSEEKPKVRNNPILVSSWTKLLSRIFELPLEDVRSWLRSVPGIQRLWHDPEQGYYIVGGLAPLKMQIQRQPSIRQWHALQGELNTELLTALIDVDWVRTNQLAGNPCVATLVKRWIECQISLSEALEM